MLSEEAQKKLKTMLEGQEGCRLKGYRDSRGYYTIGIGRNLDSKGITREEALYLLDNDIMECWEDLSKLDFFESLSEARKCALLDMRFNLGMAEFMNFRKMLEALRAGNYDQAALEVRGSKAAKETGTRYERLAYLLEKGEF